MLIERDRSCLLVVDVQERLAPAMADAATVIRNSAVLMQVAARLGVPILVSEQYPQGLGRTVPELRSLASDSSFFSKINFSCAADPALSERIGKTDREQVVICGIEAHVCVLQSALGLQQQEYECFAVADAVSSRAPISRDTALQRLGDNGVELVTTEMVVFEWLGKAGTPEFKELSRLIR